MSFEAFEDRLAEIDRQSRRRRLKEWTIDGVQLRSPDGRRLLNFGGNDYLGVVAEQSAEQSADAPTQAARLTAPIPNGASASSLVCGWSSHHEKLANAIARLERCESAVVFPSGYAACSGTVATLCQKDDLVLSDQLNHASLIDGCRMSKATKEIYPHLDVDYVERTLQSQRSNFARVWIVTDGVFSMDGEIAPLAALANVAEKYDARLIVDEAHGTGILGPNGGGLCEALQLQDCIPIRIGTLSKAVGHQGGFVAGPKIVVDYLVQFCRPLIYSTALSPVVAAGACEVIESMQGWQERREHVASLARSFREAMEVSCAGGDFEAGIPIVPVIVGSDEKAVALSLRLKEQGFYVPAIRPPTVPEGTARLRVSISAAHTQVQIDRLVDAMQSPQL